jgi:hypothetical protein
MPESRVPSEQKQFVAARAGYCCEYCVSQVRYAPDPFAVDHIIPRATGGTNDDSNLAYACVLAVIAANLPAQLPLIRSPAKAWPFITHGNTSGMSILPGILISPFY